MITIDEAIARVAREIDTIDQQKSDEAVLAMIAAGHSEAEVVAVLEHHREHFAVWRATTLESVRQHLVEEFSLRPG